jgi:hypothetical protein
MSEATFICNVCHETHAGIPLSFAVDFPDMYANMSEPEREARALISSDQCVVDETWYFIRGCVEIPIIDTSEVFLWGLWASVKEDVFNQISESWEEEGRESRRGPFKARLANSLSVYSETLNLKLSMIIQPVGTRPLFVIEDDHLLKNEQRLGISEHEAAEMSAKLLRIGGPWSASLQ